MFYNRLKKLCDDRGTSLSAVVELLGMSKGSIGNWKNGTIPNGEAIVRFSEHFHVSTDYLLLGSLNKNNNLSSSNEELIKLFSTLKPKQKTIIMGKLYEYEEINKKEAYAALVKIPNNVLEIPIKDTSEIKETRFLPEYLLPVSAGIGNYMSDDSEYAIQEYPLTTKSQKADFVIITDGDSMQPTIKDKEKLFIKSQPTIQNGEVGIFIYNNDAYCKRLFIDYENKQIILRSDNENYTDIIIKDEGNLKTIGKVLL